MLLKSQSQFGGKIREWSLNTFQEKVAIGDQDLFLVGCQAIHPDYPEVFGSACSMEDFSYDRAYWEALERLAISETLYSGEQSKFYSYSLGENSLEARCFPFSEVFPKSPESFPLSKSNGVALHESREEAAKSGAHELIERHAVLESWFGHRKPLRIPETMIKEDTDFLRQFYQIEVYDFHGTKANDFPFPIETIGVFFFPKNNKYPLVYGFASHTNPILATIKANQEAIQRLGFLWGESIPSSKPVPGTNAMAHQEWYLYEPHHKHLRMWLDGEFCRDHRQQRPQYEVKIKWVQLDRSSTDHRFHVIKAISSDCMQLHFGPYPDFYNLPFQEQLMHPIA